MTINEKKLLEAIELHSVEGIRGVLDEGLDPRSPIQGKLPIQWLTEMYTRSDRFPHCLRLLLDRGAVLDNPQVLPFSLTMQRHSRQPSVLILH